MESGEPAVGLVLIFHMVFQSSGFLRIFEPSMVWVCHTNQVAPYQVG